MPQLLDNAYLLLPLLAAILYSLAALSLKAASERGGDSLRTTFLANWAGAAAFLFFVPWNDHPWVYQALWPSLLLGLFFFLGQVFTVLSLARGDVSIATPVLATKAVFVSFLLAAMLLVEVRPEVCVAAVITVVGIGFLQATDSKSQPRHVGMTILCSLVAALSFAVFDVGTQHWSHQPAIGFGRFVPLAMVWSAILSTAFLPFCQRPARELTKTGRGYLALGVFFLTAQSAILVRTIGWSQDAPRCNIVYSSRALWSLVLVGTIGQWFANRERHLGRAAFFLRAVGATLIVLAISLVFAPPPVGPWRFARAAWGAIRSLFL